MSGTVSPALALIIGAGVLLAAGYVFWPNKGLISLLAGFRSSTRREQVEDALKLLFECEYKNVFCGLESVAGHLGISENKAVRLLDHLTSLGLISLHDDTFFLTDAGRTYALQIIRVHRIWEKYLADVSGTEQLDWHKAADQMEHRLSIEEADRLAVLMGNPVYDPHGDPIPTKSLQIPDYSGQTLSSLKKGDAACITHIEDEPHGIYAQLVALGLFPGMQFYVTSTADGKIKFVANGEELVLTPLFAAAITVSLLPKDMLAPEKFEVLSALKLGEKAEIRGISANCRGRQRRRFMDLGIIPGTVVTAEFKSASGDPVAYRIMGANIAIRKKQADDIFINRINSGQ